MPPDALAKWLGKVARQRTELHEKWKSALESNRGVIAHAAKAFGISEGHGNRLTKMFELNAWARDLRVQSGGTATGRARKRKADAG